MKNAKEIRKHMNTCFGRNMARLQEKLIKSMAMCIHRYPRYAASDLESSAR